MFLGHKLEIRLPCLCYEQNGDARQRVLFSSILFYTMLGTCIEHYSSGLFDLAGMNGANLTVTERDLTRCKCCCGKKR
jgi:hypothetical protein